MRKILVTIFIITSSIVTYAILQFNKSKQEQQLLRATDIYVRAYNTVYAEKKQLTKLILSGALRKADIPNRLSKLSSATKEQKDKIREDIYNDLKTRYKYLKTLGVKQFHIHLSNNNSFLRIHKREKYGDNLSDIRATVAYVNKNHKPIDSVEEGKAYYGVRFVYPISLQDKHLGSIEISFGVDAITASIMKQYYVLSNIYINTDIADKKNFKENKDYPYKPSHYNGYYCDMLALKEFKKISRKDIGKLKPSEFTQLRILNAGKKDQPSSLYGKSVNAVFTIIPLINKFTKENIGFIVIRSKGENIILSDNYIYAIISLIIILLALGFSLLFTLLNKKKELKIEIENKTKEQNQLLSIFNKGDTVLFKWNNDKQWSVNHVSSSVIKLLGYKPNDFYENNISYDECIYDEDLDKVHAEVMEASKLNTDDYFQHQPYRVISKSGDIKWVLDYTLVIRDKNKNIIHYLGHISDITDLRKKEAQMVKSEKMAAMGEMIGNIAHQWRQPLTQLSSILINIELHFDKNKLTKKKFVDKMEEANEQISFMSNTIDDFRNFFASGKEKKDYKIEEVIELLTHLMNASLYKNNIKLIIDIQTNFNLNDYPNEVTQALVNIVSNARDVLLEREIKNKLITIKTFIHKNNNIITIEDNAGGVDKRNLSRIFEPYFSTKHASIGTGIGLYITKTIIEENNNGKITIDNVNNGAIFTIIF